MFKSNNNILEMITDCTITSTEQTIHLSVMLLQSILMCIAQTHLGLKTHSSPMIKFVWIVIAIRMCGRVLDFIHNSHEKYTYFNEMLPFRSFSFNCIWNVTFDSMINRLDDDWPFRQWFEREKWALSNWHMIRLHTQTKLFHQCIIIRCVWFPGLEINYRESILLFILVIYGSTSIVFSDCISFFTKPVAMCFTYYVQFSIYITEWGWEWKWPVEHGKETFQNAT